jgi:hypothetical protein
LGNLNWQRQLRPEMGTKEGRINRDTDRHLEI